MHARPYTMYSMIMWQKYSNTMSNSTREYSSARLPTHITYQDDVIFDDGIHYVTSDCMDLPYLSGIYNNPGKIRI